MGEVEGKGAGFHEGKGAWFHEGKGRGFVRGRGRGFMLDILTTLSSAVLHFKDAMDWVLSSPSCCFFL